MAGHGECSAPGTAVQIAAQRVLEELLECRLVLADRGEGATFLGITHRSCVVAGQFVGDVAERGAHIGHRIPGGCCEIRRNWLVDPEPVCPAIRTRLPEEGER